MISESDRDGVANTYTFKGGKRRGESYDLEVAVCDSPACQCTIFYLRCIPTDSPEANTPSEFGVALDPFEKNWLKKGSGDPALARDLVRDCDAEDWAELQRIFLELKLHVTKEADLASLDSAIFPHDDIEDEGLLITYRQIIPFDEGPRHHRNSI